MKHLDINAIASPCGSVYDTVRESGSSELAARLAEGLTELGINIDGRKLPFRIDRTRAGRHQRSSGAWSFTLNDADGMEIVGSQWPAKICVKAMKHGEVARHTSPWNLVPEIIVEKITKENGR